MPPIRRLIWASWFIGTGLILLSWHRLAGHEVGMLGFVIFTVGWLVSLATSKSSSFTRVPPPGAEEIKYQEAVRKLTKKLESNPSNRSELLISRGRCYRSLTDWQAAIADLDEALKLSPDASGIAHVERAVCLSESGFLEQALADIDHAIDNFSAELVECGHFTTARQWRIHNLMQLGYFEDALLDCDWILAQATQDDYEIKIRTNRGVALAHLGNLDEAISELNLVIGTIETDGDRPMIRLPALHGRAGANIRLGNLPDADADIVVLQNEEGLTANNLNLMAQAETQRGDYDAAVNCYQRAISIDPSDVTNLSQLAIIQACCPVEKFRNGQQAELNARTACELTSWDNWVHLTVLAAAMAELGDFEQAVSYAETCHRLAPDSEKHERRKRIEQFRNRQPYRFDETLTRKTVRRR